MICKQIVLKFDRAHLFSHGWIVSSIPIKDK